MIEDRCKICRCRLTVLELNNGVCIPCSTDTYETNFIHPIFGKHIIRMNRTTEYDEISNKELFEKLNANEDFQEALREDYPKKSRRHYGHAHIRTYEEEREYLGIKYHFVIDRHFNIYAMSIEETGVIYHIYFDDDVNARISKYRNFGLLLAEKCESNVENQAHELIDKLRRGERIYE